MMRYSVCASSVFSGTPLDEAVRKIAAAGGRAWEFWTLGNNDIEKVYAAQCDTGVECAAMCASFEPLTDPLRHETYTEETLKMLPIAEKLGIKVLISQVGRLIDGVERGRQHESIVKGLIKIAPFIEDKGICLCIEPLNTRVDHRGYYLESSDEAYQIAAEVNSPYVKVLFDIYHQQITEGDILSHLLPHIRETGHIHIAGNPGRHEPHHMSEVNYKYVVTALRNAGYSGYAGLEYFPKGDADSSLSEVLKAMPELE